MVLRINVPKRIKERWYSIHCGTEFRVGTALSEANVSPEEFKKCWKTVQPTIPKEELFCLFDETFGSGNDVHRKVNFIKDILQRHQDMRKTRLHTLNDHIQNTGRIRTVVESRTRIYVPTRIKERWYSTHGNSIVFLIGTALSKANVNAEEFKKCWRTVQPTIPEEELFRLFDETFGSGNDVHLRVDFIKDILRRYQDSSMVIRETSIVSVAQVSSDDKDVSRARVVDASQRPSIMTSVGSQTQISIGPCVDRHTKDQAKDQFYRDKEFNLDSWFQKHAASDGTVSQNQIDMELVKHALITVTRILDTYSR